MSNYNCSNNSQKMHEKTPKAITVAMQCGPVIVQAYSLNCIILCGRVQIIFLLHML